tara:strand:+ start:1517 stop:2020 length:504 start_codon:yes stop_codon:yes gene_type:complete
LKNSKFKLSILALLFAFGSQAQVIRSQTEKWENDLDGNNLSTPNEAGTDLESTLETVASFNLIDVAGISPTTGWKITVAKEDISWNGLLIPSIQRTGIGNKCGSCSGVNVGTSTTGYTVITDAEQDFIFGEGNVSDIPLQYKIDGISLAIPAARYQTVIVFTLYGDP